jgi:glycerophosphoryl diester phosphodiesterase
VRAVHDVGCEIHVWTANAPADLHRMIALGVDGIITDYPARLRRLLAR